MIRNFVKREVGPEDVPSYGYDVWKVYENETQVGWYFVPENISGEEYEAALKSAEDKLIALGLTSLEAKAIIGRQLF